MTTRSEKTKEIFLTRLKTLDKILRKGEEESKAAGKNPCDLIALRLAPDMANFGKQIGFICQQPNQFCAWWEARDRTSIAEDPSDFNALYAVIADSMAQLEALDLNDDMLSKNKNIELPNNLSFDLNGSDYVDDWILPNFYFHITTAYNILRSQGIGLGKADYMSYLVPRIMAAQS